MTAHAADLFWVDDSPVSARFNDHYYSRDDGLAETRHVFLRGNDLPERWRNTEIFTVGELGFGTGLNLAATWHLWKQTRRAGQKLCFVSVEAFPMLPQEAARALSRWAELGDETRILTDLWPLDGARHALDEQTLVQVFPDHADAAIERFPQVDAWFLDGFSPDRNRDMWSEELLGNVAAHTNHGGTFATFTAAGWVRQNLQAAGFEVEKRAGFGKKRDMSVGTLP